MIFEALIASKRDVVEQPASNVKNLLTVGLRFPKSVKKYAKVCKQLGVLIDEE